MGQYILPSCTDSQRKMVSEMKRFIVLLVAIALAGCGVESDARKAVKGLLNDPASAEFSGIEKNGKNACGLVNAKNRLGGYVGKTPFLYLGEAGLAAIVPGVEEQDFKSLWYALKLKSNFEKEFEEMTGKCRAIRMWKETCGYEYPGVTHEMCNALLDKKGGQFFYTLQEKFDN